MSVFKRTAKLVINAFGFEIRRLPPGPYIDSPVELTKQEESFVHIVLDNQLTMATKERLWATLMSCKHVINRDIDGDFVECGVWRGGNAIVAAAIFKLYKSPRKVYLFDTFKGMTKPTEFDIQASNGELALKTFEEKQRSSHNEWAYASIDEVKSNFQKMGLLNENVIFVQGDVLETLKNDNNLPHKISVLRLDTDWYESTKKELEVFYPRLSSGGVLIIDDYGHFVGARKATDEYFDSIQRRPFLQYTDYTGRAGIKFDSQVS